MVAEDLMNQGKIPPPNLQEISIFKKNPYLNIGMLQTRGTAHILMDKISDKFTRRDVQFYDLYVKKESGEELTRLKDAQFPLEIQAN